MEERLYFSDEYDSDYDLSWEYEDDQMARGEDPYDSFDDIGHGLSGYAGSLDDSYGDDGDDY